MAIYMHSDTQMATEVILRECAGAAAASELERCEREVEQDASEIVNEIRRRTQDSVNGMRAVFKGLGALEGPKSVVLVSEGLIFEGLGSETDDLASIAADSRATLDVLLLDVPQFDATQSRRPTTPREDRDLQVTGLEQLAGAARGELYRINVTADFAFDKISRSLDGYYLIGVEYRLDVPPCVATPARRPTTPSEDLDHQFTGLEQLAGAARGELYRINVTADFAFDKISRSLDGYYLLGVESRPDDRNGRRHRIGVKT